MVPSIISSITAILAVIISFFLGKASSNTTYRKEKLEERYYKFYMPLFSKLLRISFTDFEKVIQFHGIDFVEFLLGNIRYMSVDSVKLISALYFRYQQIIIYEAWYIPKIGQELTSAEIADKDKHKQNMIEANKEFQKFTLLCCKESTDIARKLNLEPIAKSFFEK